MERTLKVKQTIVTEKVIEDKVEYHFEYDKEIFDHIKDFLLKNCKFVESSCFHSDIGSFFHYSQGGINGCLTQTITLLKNYNERYTIQINWNDTNFAYLIVDHVEE